MGKDNLKFEVIKKATETKFKFRDLKNISNLDSNSPPSVFIGSKLKYPLVNVGILSPLEREENAWMFENEKYWAEENFDIGEVVQLRGSLMNSRFQTKVKDARVSNRFLEVAKEIAMASKPVDVEIEFHKSLFLGSKQKDKVVVPHGMRASLKKVRMTGNPKIPAKIDKVVNDEIKANQAIEYLYKNNFDNYVLSKILSVGVLGLKKNKRLVPTRWSITATDDSIGKKLIEKIKEFKWIEDFELHVGEFMGNQYLIMFFPGVWTFELFELYLPGSSWNPSNEIKASTDYENFYGRKEYAFNTAGGYYATRFPILEYLNAIKQQASVLVIRLETASYWAALGVWVVRESVRKALMNKGLKFTDKIEFLESVRQIGKRKYNYDPSQVFNKSKLLVDLKTQTNLGKWF